MDKLRWNLAINSTVYGAHHRAMREAFGTVKLPVCLPVSLSKLSIRNTKLSRSMFVGIYWNTELQFGVIEFDFAAPLSGVPFKTKRFSLPVYKFENVLPFCRI